MRIAATSITAIAPTSARVFNASPAAEAPGSFVRFLAKAAHRVARCGVMVVVTATSVIVGGFLAPALPVAAQTPAAPSPPLPPLPYVALPDWADGWNELWGAAALLSGQSGAHRSLLHG